MAIGLAIGAVATLASGLIASNTADANRKNAAARQLEILERIDALQLPDIEKEKLVLQEFKSAGVLDPETEQVFNAPDSELQKIVTDPRLQQAQYGGVEALREISEGGGLRAEDKAALAEAQQQAGIAARGRREASEQSLRRRGLGGSGLEVQAALEGEQAASERLGQEALQQGGVASQRALQAILQRSQLGSQIRGQEFGESSQKAQAQDRINQFNVGQRTRAEQRRVDAANAAAAANLANKQSVSDRNVGTQHKQEAHNKGLIGKDYDRKVQKAGLAAGALGGIAKQQAAEGQDKADRISNIGSGIAKLGQAYDKYKK